MDSYLQTVHNRLERRDFKKLIVVTGTVACDLDSVACALAYAYFKQQVLDPESLVLPLCNIPRKDLPLRTEVIFWLRSCDLSISSLFFADDDVISALRDTKVREAGIHRQLILVDGHSIGGPFAPDWPVCEVIDHHAVDPQCKETAALLDQCQYKRIEAVGSCASLVAAKIFSEVALDTSLVPHNVWRLLYGAILMDTVGVSDLGQRLGRLTDLDLRMAGRLEDLCLSETDPVAQSRPILFASLEKAKFDVRELSIWDVLRRDMKFVSNPSQDGNDESICRRIVCSTLSGVDLEPCLTSSGLIDAAKRLCSTTKSSLLVGITVGYPPELPLEQKLTEKLRKGLFIYSPVTLRNACADQLTEFLCRPNHNLQLEPNKPTSSVLPASVRFAGWIRNPKVTRKAILPVLLQFVRSYSPAIMTSMAGTTSPSAKSSPSGTHGPGSPHHDKRKNNSESNGPRIYPSTEFDTTLDQSAVDRLRSWLASLTVEARNELVIQCLNEVHQSGKTHPAAFQPLGVLDASVMREVTELLIQRMPPEVGDANGKEKRYSGAHEALHKIKVAFQRGRRKTMPVQNEIYERRRLPRRYPRGSGLERIRRPSEGALSLPGEKKPTWLETEYLPGISSWIPDPNSNQSVDSIEDVSFRLYRRLSALPRIQSHSHTSSTGETCSNCDTHDLNDDELDSNLDEAELALLEASFGELDQSLGCSSEDCGSSCVIGRGDDFSSIPADEITQRGLEWLRMHHESRIPSLTSRQSSNSRLHHHLHPNPNAE